MSIGSEPSETVMEDRPSRAAKKEGLLIVHTGNGKGKTTAALGMLVRALGHGFPCAVVQFIKGGQPTAEVVLAQVAAVSGAALSWERCGQGFTWKSRDREADRKSAEAGWTLVQRHLAAPGLRFLLLDELNIALQKGLLDTSKILAELTARQPGLHVVVTGRSAPQPLLEAADLVTEMREVKHPFKAGLAAQAGIEF